MDAAGHYRKLLQLGRDAFLAAAAPAVLVRFRHDPADPISVGSTTASLDDAGPGSSDDTLPFGKDMPLEVDLEIFPLAKKPGASFPDRITIGRTSNNDVVIADPSVSRLHAYVKHTGDAWSVTDAGSKNGSWLRGIALDARKELALPASAVLRFGEVDVTFYLARDLFAVLGGTA
ncbi:MAG TPA: FHA domain-containing protein [Kofleriaceae bacterium]